MSQVSLQELLEAGVHFGHQARRWNPKMKQYIYTTRDGVHIIDLAITAEKLQTATTFLSKVAEEGGSVLFIGTKRQAKPIIEEEAKRCGAYFIIERWMGGLLTNWDQIGGNTLKSFRTLKEKREKGEFEKFTKKEKALIDKEIERSERFLSGIENLTQLPKAIVIIDTNREMNAIREAVKIGIPVIAVVDTNSNPDSIDFPIPGNDDAIRSIKLLAHTLSEAILEGREKFEKNKQDKKTEEVKEIKKTEVKKQEEAKEDKKPSVKKSPAKAKKEAKNGK